MGVAVFVMLVLLYLLLVMWFGASIAIISHLLGQMGVCGEGKRQSAEKPDEEAERKRRENAKEWEELLNYKGNS